MCVTEASIGLRERSILLMKDHMAVIAALEMGLAPK